MVEPSGRTAWHRLQYGGVEFPIPLAAGGLAVALIGNGGWSLDAVLSLTYSDSFTLIWLALMVVGDLALLAIRAQRRAAAPQEPAAQS